LENNRQDKAVYGLDAEARYRLKALAAAYDLSMGQMMRQLVNEKWDSVAEGLELSDRAVRQVKRLTKRFYGPGTA